MNKIENYLGIANHDIQVANNSDELKSYVASILCEIDELQQENKQLKEKLDCDLQWAFKYEKQVDNWNKLKEFIKSQNDGGIFSDLMIISDTLNKMQELEGKNKV